MKQLLRMRTIVAAALLFVGISAGFAQPDTLHLYYHHTATTPHDTTLAKMDKWIKSLNGQHQDLRIVGYFHKYEFRKFAQERVDEMFLVVNRKARSLFTIKETVAQRGKDYQRTTVDLIYQRTGGGEKKAAAKAADKPAKKEETSSGDDDSKGKAVKAEKSDKSDKADKSGKSEKADKEKKAVKKEEAREDKSDEKAEKKSEKSAKKSDKDKSDDDDKKESKSSKTKDKPAKKDKPSDGKTETWEAKPIE